MIMDGPIPIRRDGGEEEMSLTAQEYLQWQKQRHMQRQQWVMLGILGFIVVGFLTPLFVWLTRLALGQ